jgi:hypothetical protein
MGMSDLLKTAELSCAFDWEQSVGLDVVAKGVFNGYSFEYNIDIWTAGKPH